MATKLHASLTDADGLHEPKGISSAAVNSVYVSDGTGGGTYKVPDVLGDAKADSLTLNNTVWSDVKVNLLSQKVPSTGAPTLTQLNDNGSGSVGVFAYLFGAAAENSVYFEIQLPHGIKAGSTLKPHIHWMASDATAGDVVWGLEYVVSNYDLTSNNTIITTTTSTAPGSANKQVIAAFPDIISGSSGTVTHIKESTIIIGRLFRDGANGSDTYAAGAFGLSMDFHAQFEKIGSLSEYP